MIGIRSSRVSPATSRRHAAVEQMDNEVGRLELIRDSLVAIVNEMRANVIARTGDIVEVRAVHVAPRRAERSREEHDNHNQQRRRRT